MTMTKGIIKTLAKRVKEPAEILSQLNRVFYENAPRNIFIFYTDGISEAMNNKGEEFGEERLEALLRRNSAASAKEILENIRKTVFAFTGSAPQHDDFTMVVVKVN